MSGFDELVALLNEDFPLRKARVYTVVMNRKVAKAFGSWPFEIQTRLRNVARHIEEGTSLQKEQFRSEGTYHEIKVMAIKDKTVYRIFGAFIGRHFIGTEYVEKKRTSGKPDPAIVVRAARSILELKKELANAEDG